MDRCIYQNISCIMGKNETAFIIVIGSCFTVTSQIWQTVIIFKFWYYLNDTIYITPKTFWFLWFRLNSVNSKFYMLLHLMVWTFCNATIYFHSHVWSKKVPLMHYLIHTLRENAVEALFNPYATCLNQTFDDETDTLTIFYKFL